MVNCTPYNRVFVRMAILAKFTKQTPTLVGKTSFFTNSSEKTNTECLSIYGVPTSEAIKDESPMAGFELWFQYFRANAFITDVLLL